MRWTAGSEEFDTASLIRQVQVDLFAQPPLGADTEAVVDSQHADHQLGVDRWAAGVAVERRELVAQFTEVEEAIDATQQVIAWHVIVKVEGAEESVLVAASPTHYLDALPSNRCHQHRRGDVNCQGVFQQNRPSAVTR
jgi:hypothetical protein